MFIQAKWLLVNTKVAPNEDPCTRPLTPRQCVTGFSLISPPNPLLQGNVTNGFSSSYDSEIISLFGENARNEPCRGVTGVSA